MKFASGAGIFRILLALFTLGYLFAYFTSINFSSTQTKPRNSVFTEETGIEIRSNWKLISSGDSHGGMMGDGETHFVFRVPQPDIEQLLNSSPPWSAAWLTGPVEHEIGFHCNFGTSGVSWQSASDSPEKYSGNPGLVSVLSASQTRYDAKERCCESLRWHNGHLLVIDPLKCEIWFSKWDF